MFSARIRKLNRHGKFQDRTLMLTDKHLYNLGTGKKPREKRRIVIEVCAELFGHVNYALTPLRTFKQST